MNAYPVAAEEPGLLELVELICEWEMAPSAWIGGRSALHLLPTGLAGRLGLRSMKLKGLGLSPREGVPAQPPRNDPYDRWPGQEADGHFAIRSDGEFGLGDGDPAPLGGLTMEGANRELECARDLCRDDVPSVVPVASVSYPEVEFRGNDGEDLEVGVAVTATPMVTAARCSAMGPGWSTTAGEDDAEIIRAANALGLPMGQAVDADFRLRMLGESYRRFGASLRAFSAAGWYRYSGHPANIQVDDSGRALMVDLDSCRPMRGLSPEVADLEAVRDGMSGLYNLACTFFLPRVMVKIDDAALRGGEPFSAFLDGWDPDSAGKNGPAASVIVDYVVESRNRLRQFGEFLDTGTPAADALYRHVRHDRDLTFAFFFRHLYRRRLDRGVDLRSPITLAELDRRLLRFAGWPRYDRMIELDARIGDSHA